MIFEPVRLDGYVERKYVDRRAGNKGERGMIKETEKNSGTETRVSRRKCSL